MDLGINGKTAIVTGASKGIGRAIVLELLAEGANVVAAARSEQNLKELANAAAPYAERLVTVATDCTHESAPAQVIDKTITDFGSVDILVNNLGTGTFEHDWNTDVPDFQRIFEINLFSAVRFTRTCVPHMQDRKWGRIINMSSVSGHSGLPRMGDYNASKAALSAWSKTLSLELGPYITVNSVCPGFIETPLWDSLAKELTGTVADTVAGVYSAMTDANLVTGRYGRPEEVASLVAYLASQQSAFITGASYNVDGGYTKFVF